MYSLKNLWQQQPAAIAEAVRQLLIVLTLAGVIMLSSDLVLAILSAVSVILSLFTYKSVFTKGTVDKMVDDALNTPVPEDGAG
jgi:hypothetical protein